MPFDAAPERTIEDRVIDQILKLLGPRGENWFRGSGEAPQYCLIHALNAAKNDLCITGDNTQARVEEAIRVIEDRYMLIHEWNDQRCRTFDDILTVLEMARTIDPVAAKAERQQEINRLMHGVIAELIDIGLTLAVMLPVICIPT